MKMGKIEMGMSRLRLFIIGAMLVILQMGDAGVMGNLVFKVQKKFNMEGRNKSWSAIRAHDLHRFNRIRRRSLAALNVPLGGDGFIDNDAVYIAKVGLGTPRKDYYLQIDTGSDLTWVNCAGCSNCQKKTSIKHVKKLEFYDPASSKTYQKCQEKNASMCEFRRVYASGRSDGYYVTDIMYLPQVTGDFKTGSMFNFTTKFGCATKLEGRNFVEYENAYGGIMGLDASEDSIISQLGEAGKIKRKVAHCFKGGEEEGGIFAIGDVVSPKVKTTPLVANGTHYMVYLKKIDVGGEAIPIPKEMLDSESFETSTVIDSGASTATMPEVIFKPLMDKILARQRGLKTFTNEDNKFLCFPYTDMKVDEKFPVVTFHFENSLTLVVYPHEYMFKSDEGKNWCFVFGSDLAKMEDGSPAGFILLGDTLLKSKLVIYDIENKNIGWTPYDCSSSIKMRDDESGKEYSIKALDISRASSLTFKRILIFFSILVVLL